MAEVHRDVVVAAQVDVKLVVVHSVHATAPQLVKLSQSTPLVVILVLARVTVSQVARVLAILHQNNKGTVMIIKENRPEWRDGESKNITFIVTKDCQLACKYCYLVGKNEKERM